MAREWYPTPAEVISAAARGLGLVSEDIADPYASTNPAVLQMCQLLTDLGQDLARDHDWQQLRLAKKYDLSSITGFADFTGIYNHLPAGLVKILPETVWDITNDRPLAGPLSSQQWAEMATVTSAETVPKFWRLWNDMFGVYLTSTVSAEVRFEYISRFWVAETAVAEDPPYTADGELFTAATTDAADEASDRLFFDKRLLVEGLKLRFAEAKGMPSDGHRRNYEDALGRAKSSNEPGRTLSLNRPRGLPWPRLPDTGWGGA